MRELGCEDIAQFAASLALENFDTHLRDELTKHFKDSSHVPTIDDITEFLEPLESNLQSLNLDGRPSSQNTPSKRPSSNPKNSPAVCPLCKEQHRLFRCPVFLGYDTSRKQRYIKDKRGCTNCLALNHTASECTSSYTCKECNGRHSRHNTLLHRSSSQRNAPASTTEEAVSLTNISHDSDRPSTDRQQTPPQVVFLHTAVTKATHQGNNTKVRVAFDSGASSSLITESIVTLLRLKRYPRRLQIEGAGGREISKHFVEMTLQSTADPSKSLTTKFNVVRKLPSSPPPHNVEQVKAEPHLQGIPLADPQLGGQLDVLLGGVDYQEHHSNRNRRDGKSPNLSNRQANQGTWYPLGCGE